MPARDDHLRRAIVLSTFSVLFSGGMGAAAVGLALVTGSLSLLGFGFDAAVDSVASIALIWRFAVERRVPERGERVEKIAEAVLGLVLVTLAIYLGWQAVNALLTRHGPNPSVPATVLLAVSLLVLPPLARLKRHTARALGSGSLRADSVLTAVAGALAAVSLAAVVLAGMGLWWADAAGALIAVLVLAREGVFAIASSRQAGRDR